MLLFLSVSVEMLPAAVTNIQTLLLHVPFRRSEGSGQRCDRLALLVSHQLNNYH